MASIEELIAADGVVRANPELSGRVAAAVRRGDLVRLLPGVYGRDSSIQSRILAAKAWDPNAVFVGESAAKIGWWPELPLSVVGLASRTQVRRGHPGFAISMERLHPELISERGGLRFASPAASVIQILPAVGGAAIDECLRRRAASLAGLRWALSMMKGRPGNTEAARLIAESRDNPWSELEREAHKILRRERITGWVANHPVRLPSGQLAFLDLAFRGLRIAIEIDGWQFHKERTSFVDDRWRDAQLQMAGWIVIRLTVETLHRLPEVVRALLRLRRMA